MRRLVYESYTVRVQHTRGIHGTSTAYESKGRGKKRRHIVGVSSTRSVHGVSFVLSLHNRVERTSFIKSLTACRVAVALSCLKTTLLPCKYVEGGGNPKQSQDRDRIQYRCRGAMIGCRLAGCMEPAVLHSACVSHQLPANRPFLFSYVLCPISLSFSILFVK